MCSRRPGASCSATDPRSDEWAALTGRVASQWFNVFRFIGLASDDGSYLDDYRQGLARAMTQNYLEGTRNGVRYGFWTPSVVTGGSRLDGTLVSVTANTSGGDPTLYATGKAALAGVLARANHTTFATALTVNGIAAATTANTPMGKEQALYLNQITPAVAKLI